MEAPTDGEKSDKKSSSVTNSPAYIAVASRLISTMSHPSTKAAQMNQIISLVRAQLAILEKEQNLQDSSLKSKQQKSI